MKFLKRFLLPIFIGLAFAGCATHLFWENYTDPDSPRYARRNGATPKNASPSKIKVVTFNVERGRDSKNVIKAFREVNELKDADIILMQERDHHDVKMIAEELDYNYVYYPSAYHKLHGYDLGNAVFSKWPIIDDEKFILNGREKEPLQRIATGAIIDINGLHVYAVSVHLGVFTHSHERSYQIQSLLDHISHDHAIIGGDFNTYSDKHFYSIKDAFTDNNFYLASQKAGWTYIMKPLLFKRMTLDHIYAKGLRVMDSGKTEPQAASDHYPVWSILSLY